MDISEIYKRADLRNISMMLLHEDGFIDSADKTSLQERIEKSKQTLEELISTADKNCACIAEESIWEIIEEYSEIYFEAGLRCGLKLSYELYKDK